MPKRRGHGEGSIYQRASDGKWVGSIDLGYVDGKRKRKPVYGKTRKEVADKLRHLQLQQAQGHNVAPERETVEAYLTHWLEEYAKHHYEPTVLVLYTSILHTHVIPRIGRIVLSKLTAEHINGLLNVARDTAIPDTAKQRSPYTIRNIKTVLSAALSTAVDWKRIPHNPATHVRLPRIRKSAQRKIQPLTVEQARALLSYVKGYPLEAAYRVALSLGLRRGEVLALRWQDVSGNTLTVRGSLTRLDGTLKRKQAKTEDSQDRVLICPRALLSALDTRKQQQLLEQRNAGAAWKNTENYIFTTRRGTPWEPSNFYRHFKATLRHLGLPDTIRLHDLRHSCAAILIAQNVHPRTIMEILGHASIDITMDTYGHIFEDVKRQAATAIDDVLGDDSG